MAVHQPSLTRHGALHRPRCTGDGKTGKLPEERFLRKRSLLETPLTASRAQQAIPVVTAVLDAGCAQMADRVPVPNNESDEGIRSNAGSDAWLTFHDPEITGGLVCLQA